MRIFLAFFLVTVAWGGGCAGSQEPHEASRMELRDDKQPPLDALFSHPSPESIPGGQRGEQIRLGYEIVVHTQDYAAPYVGNALTCANCHLDGGLDPNSAPFVGLSRVYPEMSRRAGRVLTLADRINECVERGLNGKPIPQDSHKLRAVVAYIDWLSKDVPEGSRMAWRGIPPIKSTRPPDVGNGAKVFTTRCAFCHGADGRGTHAAPPLWGDRSYNRGAEMARLSVAASFIQANMPRTRGWALSDNEAYDVAAYINGQPRPDFPGKTTDWPQGGKPADVPY
ncbi:MAG: c-type cytochrome [Nitrospira sp.]|nr:c-type cytochrome [Nitrospira sp.]MEB2338871.1 c-type cytochrome [Nitrospirales bacterium]